MKYWANPQGGSFLLSCVPGDITARRFLIGAAIALFSYTVADRLEALGFDRAMATIGGSR